MSEDLVWISMVDRLADGDITKHDQIYKTNYIQVLTLMSYWNERDKHIEQVNRAAARKNK